MFLKFFVQPDCGLFVKRKHVDVGQKYTLFSTVTFICFLLRMLFV